LRRVRIAVACGSWTMAGEQNVADVIIPQAAYKVGLQAGQKLRDECYTACIEEGDVQQLYNRVMDAIIEYDKQNKGAAIVDG